MAFYLCTFLVLPLLFYHAVAAHHHHWSSNSLAQIPFDELQLPVNGIPYSSRAYWMRRAISSLAELSPSPCPFAAFGTVIVNHTNTAGPGELVCMGINTHTLEGNPITDGEISAINNCSKILTDPTGRNMTPAEALAAFKDLSLYTTAEACPMCASAIRWAGFHEYIYGTSIDTLIAKGFDQIPIRSSYIFEKASVLPSQTVLLGNVLANETDPYFSWQFDADRPCPPGCSRSEDGSTCERVSLGA